MVLLSSIILRQIGESELKIENQEENARILVLDGEMK